MGFHLVFWSRVFFWTESVESPVRADVLRLTVVAMPPSNAVSTFGQSAVPEAERQKYEPLAKIGTRGDFTLTSALTQEITDAEAAVEALHGR